jgi:hypothetical protein
MAVHWLMQRRRLRIVLHLLVLAGLLLALGVAPYADRYFNRGVSSNEDLAPIPHTDVNPMGVNTFLDAELDHDNFEPTLDMVADGGFTFVRQLFPWYDIQPDPDRYRWAKYDRIVDLAVERDLEIIARLDKPPRWAREGQPNLDRFPAGPPNDIADYAEFVSSVVSRYRGRIHYIQIWNEPNLEAEWGGQPIDPAAFTRLLKAAYIAAKQADPNIIVLVPGLAPTEQTGPTNLSDLLFLQGMYDAGAKDYFDIATVMLYGYGYSPYDRRVEFARNNFSRPIQTREIMMRNGDSGKPIWAAEYGWVSLPENWAGERAPWGRPISADKQAEYLYRGYLRAQGEWPWMGVMCIWSFRWVQPPDAPGQVRNPTRGFAIVNYDFTPQPAYSLLSRARAVLDRAYTGSYAADSRWIRSDGGWSLIQGSRAARLIPEQPGVTLRIPFSGTRLDLVLGGSGKGYAVSIDGHPAPGLSHDEQGRAVIAVIQDGERVVVADGLDDGPHLAEIVALGGDDSSIALRGFVVMRHIVSAWTYPWIEGALGVAIFLNLGSLWWTLRREGRVATDPASQPAAS